MKGNIRKLKLILVTSTLLLGMLAIGGTNSKAALQANATTHKTGKTATGANWITNIRQMETAGQTMGLNEKLNKDLTTDGDSNNIDIHMMRSTEYGAMAILSASGFGYSGKIQYAPVKSTTGNVTGVYVISASGEWVAGVFSASEVGKNARYYDLYTSSQTSARVGDALGLDSYADNPGCSGWHEGSITWRSPATDTAKFRGRSEVFSHSSGSWNSVQHLGRGTAVVGQGL